MKLLGHRAFKSFTRKALVISMVLHLLLICTLFYFVVSEQQLVRFKDSLAVSITTVPKQQLTKKPMKEPRPQQRKTTVFDIAKMPQAEFDTIAPDIKIEQPLDHTTPIITEQPRLEDTNTAPDVDANVSTAVRELRQVEESLSNVESAQSTIGNPFGTKRSGSPGVQRTPMRSTLNIPIESTGNDEPTDLSPLYETKPKLVKVTFSNVMKTLAEEIAESSDGGPIDIVFIIDASGSMGDNINAVAIHLSEMIDVYKSSDIDYELGLTKFNTADRGKKNDIEVLPLTKNLNEYRRNINAIVTGRDENALDAIEKTVRDMKFRATSQKHFILVTDEPLTSIEGRTFRGTVDLCREYGIHVNILGLPDDKHQQLAMKTDGNWHAIPENPRRRQVSGQYIPTAEKARKQYLSNTKWSDLQKVGKNVLLKAEDSPVDVVIFIDGSNSMEDKISGLLTQIEIWYRDWDNSLIDYQVGIVRFRMRGSVNMVNVYNPPQTLEQTKKIIELPSKLNEDLSQAIYEGMRRIKLREHAQTHIIIVTDEPLSTNVSYEGVIQYLAEKHAVVNVVGTFDGFLQKVAQQTKGVWVAIPNGNLVNQPYW